MKSNVQLPHIPNVPSKIEGNPCMVESKIDNISSAEVSS